MDAKLRLLLRKFAASGDPRDAAAFASTILRSEDTAVDVWIVQFLHDRNDSDYITVHDSKEKAFEKAGDILSDILEDRIGQTWKELFDDEDELVMTEDWVIEAHDALTISQDYEYAIGIYENHADGRPILVYSQTVR